MTQEPSHRGLFGDIKEALRLCVMAAMPIWRIIRPLDAWNIGRLSGSGDIIFTVENRKGKRTIHGMCDSLVRLPEFLAVRKLLIENQPELFVWFGAPHGGCASGLESVILNLIIRLDTIGNDELGANLRELLDELDDRLQTRIANFKVFAPIRIQCDRRFEESASLINGVVLRCLTEYELENFLSHDADFPSRIPSYLCPSMVLEVKFQSPLYFSPGYTGDFSNPPHHAARKAIELSQHVLHFFKSQVASVVRQDITLQDRGIPSFGIFSILLAEPLFAPIITLQQSEMLALRELGARLNSGIQTDSLVEPLLRIYGNAITDPRNELIRLYEIRDALCERFSGDVQVKRSLNISSRDWRNFGKLCNDEPLHQGRHRGKNLSLLRDASQDELIFARNFARQLMQAYFHFINI